MKVTAHHRTEVGLVRKGNEDSWLHLPEQGFFAVADGMGGHAAGEVASALAVATVRDVLTSSETRDRIREEYDAAQAQGLLSQDIRFEPYLLRFAIEEANLAIHERARRDTSLRSMGTTFVALFLGTGGRAWVANVGDSRLYRLRDGALEQVTMDHSLVNEYLKLNLLTGEQARTFPMKNIIVRALGLSEWVEVDTFEVDSRVGDRYLLCSDGLTDLVSDDRIREGLVLPEPSAAVDDLVKAALDAGGADNVTVLLAAMEE